MNLTRWASHDGKTLSLHQAIGWVLLLSLLAPGLARASAGQDGAAFLDIPVGAGPAAMGSAYSALATDAYAPVANPAGLAFLDGTQLAGQHLSYLEGIHDEFVSAVVPMVSGGLGVSAQYLGSGDIAGTDVAGESIGNFSNHYAAYSLAYGHELTPALAVGAAGKLIDAKLADQSAIAYAGDIGLLYRQGPKLSLSATADNLGSKLTFLDQADSLPMAFHVGSAYQFDRRWLLTAEGVYRKSGALSGRLGLQWRPIEILSLRAGYRTDALAGLSAITGMSAGFGLRVWGQELSYAWVPYGDLGDTQYFSIVLRFGKDEAKRNLIQYQTIKSHRSVKGNSQQADPDYEQLMQILSSDDRQVVSRTNTGGSNE
jgi:hypothetical protein